MKNTLSDLNNYLFEQLERINDDSITNEEFERELRKTDSMVKISETIIQNGELAFRTMQHIDKYGYRKSDKTAPPMLMDKEGAW